MIAQGLKAHQQGDLFAAGRAYRAVLEQDANHPDALHLLGLLAGRDDVAAGLGLIERAIASSPRVSAYHNNLGNLLVRAGEAERAEKSYRKALRLDERNGDAWINLGKLLYSDARLVAAREALGKAIRFAPRSLEARLCLGRLELELGAGAAAVHCYRHAVDLAPDSAAAWLGLGKAQAFERGWDAAESSLRRAIELDATCAEAWFVLGNVQRGAGRLAEAVACYRALLARAPGEAEGWNNLGATLVDMQPQRRDEALAALCRAVELKPDYAEAWYNLGKAYGSEAGESALAALGRALELDATNAAAHHELGVLKESQGFLEEAVVAYRRSLALAPGSTAVRSNLGALLALLGEQEGLSRLRALVSEQPHSPQAHWTLSMALLLHGECAQGWREFEWRRRADALRDSERTFAQPEWQGEPLDGRTILLYADQGFGDTLQFARYVPLVAARGGRVVLEVQPGLKRLLSGMPAVASCVARGEPLPDFATHAPLMSLPLMLGGSAIPQPSAPPVSAASALTPAGPRPAPLRVGLAWAGNPGHQRDKLRSVPAALLEPLAQVDGVEWTSLQRTCSGMPLPDGLHFYQACAEDGDFADTAELIASLDLVITVDTAIAHLAGTLGKPVWVLLDRTQDWRWGLRCETTPWYPSARLFRQVGGPEWAPVVSHVARELHRLAACVASHGDHVKVPLQA